MGEFEYATAVCPVVFRGDGGWGVVGEEVEVKFVVGEGQLVDFGEAEEFVVFDWRNGWSTNTVPLRWMI